MNVNTDSTREAYDNLLRTTDGTGTRRELGTVRQTGFRKPKQEKAK